MAAAPSPPQPPRRRYRWDRRRYPRWQRSADIWRFVLLLSFRLWLIQRPWTYFGGFSSDRQNQRRRKLASWIRETCLDLGPTFIKVGQLFSTRADLFPAEYVEELSKLQDQVPAFDLEQVQQILSNELGASPEELFSDFDPVPLAAASLGQVHRARLKTGEAVVVKVQRPGLQQLFTVDLAILRGIAEYFQRHRRWGQGRDWVGIYEECCRILWQETDYLREGRNADRFRRDFRDCDWLLVPRVYWRYASPRVLTLEYLPGIKISDYTALEAANLDRQKISQLNAEAYLRQVLNHGFFHADPHPGNLAVSPTGRLIFYDFGMMGEIRTDVRSKLMQVFLGIARKDADDIVSALVELGALLPTGDLGPVRRSVQYLLDNFLDRPFEGQSISAISDDIYEIAYDQPFRFPATFTFVMRAFSTLEGVGKGLDPDFNFMTVAKPYALEIMSDATPNPAGLLNEFSRQALAVGNSALGLPRRLDDTLDKLEQGDLRVRVRASESDRLLRRLLLTQQSQTWAILTAALWIGSAIVSLSALPLLAIAPFGLGLIPLGLLIRTQLRLRRSERMGNVSNN
ncbi:AarF/ABC1/UbiB kinase family protein [Synechococcus elongatus FACHB-1061]|nr:AarF/ABC1/UbiB kinase family protein [Synechococcus elongatus]MBD2588772.1 AarF/ABC1/UbiB kinase family protein [Synechococcus elongatus FACHB-242]MBD2689640.1 AarF/ABC1/UbiB kinase family protein [Synechococcus elongatus FACHB-1061]MBD2708246.1 AarF/ABC1/UbiB kinase family protein [Synechococcus elongatus PCC 7942 = FACHB-805]WKW06902.1 AarF/ABC1/UbiB kinase family protein [Synechococcus elongatus PCC 7942 = FACHB-805]